MSKKRDEEYKAWGTIDELKWIENIGKVLNNRTGREEGTKTQYLEGYLRSAKYRTNWGDVNSDVCIKRANQLLGHLRNGY